MITTDLKVGDRVILDEPAAIILSKDGSPLGNRPRGSGYTVTEITDHFVECTHLDMDNCADKTSFFGQNDLWRIQKEEP